MFKLDGGEYLGPDPTKKKTPPSLVDMPAHTAVEGDPFDRARQPEDPNKERMDPLEGNKDGFEIPKQ